MKPTFSQRLPLAFCLIFSAAVATLSPAFAQDFVFTKIVDSNDPIPNGAGVLFGTADQQPALDAGTVVFRNGTNGLAPDSIWSVTSAHAFTKLVDLNTTVPGGTGKFSSLILDFSAPGFPVLSAGTVIFAGRDSATTGYTGGLYSVPAGGGAITRIVNRNVAIPGGTGNFNGGLQYFSVDNGRLAFNGVGVGNSGVFSANVNGTGLVAIADVNHPAHPEFVFPVTNFGFPSISGTTVAFYGNTVFDPSNGYNALYTTPSSGGFLYGEPATSLEPLPGDPTTTFHTRFGTPRLDGSTIFFRADDANTTSPNFSGIFSVATGGGVFTNLVDINDSLPGLTNINSNSFLAYSAAGGMLAFTAFDDSGNSGVYSHTGSTITKVLATGDGGPFADLHATAYSPTIGTEAVSDGNIVLRADVRFSAAGFYLATPFASSADLEPTLSIAPSNASVGSDTTVNVSVNNNGPAAAQTITLVVTLPPGLDFKSAAGGTYDATARTVTFSVASLASGAMRSFAVIATVNAMGPLTVSAYANATTADSDRPNNHVFATANAVFASTGEYVIRKIVDNLTPVPDRTGETFGIGAGLDPLPALDGDKLVFIAFDPNNLPVIWSANADGSGGLLRLVDTTNNIPGGAGEKFGYMKALRLRNGNTVFFGIGADGLHDGIYTIPVGGGTLKSVVASGSVRPEGTGATFGYQDFLQGFAYGYLGDGQMTFTAQQVVYAYPAAGGGTGRVLVYPGSNIPIAGNYDAVFFGAPAISGTRVVFSGVGGSEALLGTYLDEHRFFAVADTATASPSTPGQNFVLSTQDSFGGVQIEGETVVFRAFSGTNAAIKGIYSVTGDGPAVKLVDTNTNVPGGNGKFTSFSTSGSPDLFALSDGEVVFLGVDADNVDGLYSVPATGGTITRIVAVGDQIGDLQLTGNASFGTQPFQPNSLGEHQIAFRANFLNTTTNTSGIGIFVAGRVMNRLANIATRLNVGAGDHVGIGGLIIDGTAPKTVLIRGIGPSLAPFGVPDVLLNPTLELLDSTGSLDSNDDWRETQEQAIIDTGLEPSDDLESAIIATLDPGRYTAILRGKDGTTGNGLVEVYDLDPSTELATRLANIATRGFVQSGDNVMIGGVILEGAAEKHLLLRAIGPSLADVGVPDVLLDPTLEVKDAMGLTLANNDDWRESQETLIEGPLQPGDDRESAVDIHLMPGRYTAIVRGKNDTTGNALVEAYELP
ncbi:MAG TPA: DUF11 domain-containing protein [Chthoniobacterales bacterium]|nr:DUF11 domain-containing protein [Chthoniobacterales bacterium]